MNVYIIKLSKLNYNMLPRQFIVVANCEKEAYMLAERGMQEESFSGEKYVTLRVSCNLIRSKRVFSATEIQLC